MEERRRIIIQTDATPDEASSRRPYFNTESTKAARPVVPLPDAPQPAAGNRRWQMIALFVLVAVAAGGATGFAISVYHNRQPTEAPLAVQPIASKAHPSALTWNHIPEEETLAEADTDSTAPDTGEETGAAPSAPDVTKNEPPARADKPVDKQREREAARDNRADSRDDRRAENREPRDDRAIDEARDQRRDERRARRARNDRNRDDELPQDPLTRRSRDDINRVREIFEGIP